MSTEQQFLETIMSTRLADFVAAGNNTGYQLRAPYNFVRLDERILQSPLGDEPDIHLPRAEHVSGELVVEWQVETPILVGGANNDQPFKLDDRWALPGSSLRGMVRSVMEIVSYSRLAFVDDRHVALRDMSHVTWTNINRKVLDANGLRAGWITRERRGGRLCYVLTEVDAVSVDIDLLANSIGSDRETWHDTGVAARHDLLVARFGEPSEGAGVPRETELGWVDDLSSSDRGTVVVTGQAVRDNNNHAPKLVEWIFLASDGTPKNSYELPAETWRRFQSSQFRQAANIAAEKRQLWSFWWEKLRNDRDGSIKVPVFFYGEPSPPDVPGHKPRPADKPERFFMSLTRFAKIPYDFSVGEIAQRTHPDIGTLDGHLDLTEALMGFVPHRRPLDSEASLPRARALRSRVEFSLAELQGEQEVLTRKINGVTEAPRVSFYPHYLRPEPRKAAIHPLDFTSRDTVLAGRKRYPARSRCSNLPPGSENQANSMNLLWPTRERPIRFTSRIRFRNLCKVELGALVWAITLGGGSRKDHPLRHMLGRAKAMGFGQVHATISEADLGEKCLDNDTKAPTINEAMATFESWVAAGLGATSFTDLIAIRDLCAMADPAIGRELAGQDLLYYPGGPTEVPQDILDAYQRIKQQTGRRPGAQSPGRAGMVVSDTLTDGDYLRLPPYPWSLE